MRDLEGNLDIFDASSIMQMLHLTQATGELCILADNNNASVFIERGNVTFAVIADRPMKLGQSLLKDKLVSTTTLNRILKKKKEGKRLGESLVEEGIISDDELLKALEGQIKEVIYEIVRWRRGTFYFENGKRAQQDITINVPPDHLMLEGLKRLDEERDAS